MAEPTATTPPPVPGAPPVDPAAAAAPPPSPPSAVTAPPEGAPPPAEPPKEPPAEAPAAFAPDKLTLPEGVKADDATFKSFGEIMTADMSPQDRGQKLLDLYTGAVKQARDASTQAWNDVNTQWQTQTKADPDIGGPKWDATKATVAKAIDSLPADLAAGFRQALDITGAGNHPAIVKGLYSWATKLTEGGHVTGAPAGSGAKPSVKEAFYPNSPDMK